MMVATTTDGEQTKLVSGKKVSKPLMEKKRRARINKSLDQLKSLLENHYSSSIRKRKLEKADILELTVKHLKNLQKTRRFTTPAAEVADFRSGFHSCLANFNQYLLMADNLSRRERWMLAHLSAQLSRSPGGGDSSSTSDSGRRRAEGPGPLGANGSSGVPPCEDTRRSPSSRQPARSSKSTVEKSQRSVTGSPWRNEAASSQHDVWRPW